MLVSKKVEGCKTFHATSVVHSHHAATPSSSPVDAKIVGKRKLAHNHPINIQQEDFFDSISVTVPIHADIYAQQNQRYKK